jgi:polysaccharide biosynthesis transport protein
VNISQFVAVLRARWLVFVLVLVLTVLTTAGISLYVAKQYTASASVVIDVKPDPLSLTAFGGMASPAFMATQVDVLLSERVAKRVVRNLKLTELPNIREQWQAETGGRGSIEQWLATTFSSQLDVRPSRESNVIVVAYTAPDPQFAAALANAFVQAYLDTSLELRVEPARQYTGFFESRTKEARDNLEKAQAALSAFQNENGIVATDERLDVETARLAELSSQLVALQALSADSGSRQSQLAGAGADKLQEVFANPVVAGLKSDISRLEGRLKELNARLGDKHPSVLEARANVDELRVRMDAEIKRVGGGVQVTATINRQREAQVRAELEAQRAKLLKFKTVRDDGAVLVRDVENAQRTYDALVVRLNQTSLESQTTQSNVNLLTQAVPPIEHASPRLGVNLLLAVVLGALLGVGIALALEMLDRRVRGDWDLEQVLGLPVLGVIPAATGNGKARLALSGPAARR